MCRNTNPLRPLYNWRYTEDKKILGPIEGIVHLVYSNYLYKRYEGNTYYLKTKDICGAQGDTIVRGIITKRQTNPLNPKYKYLNHSKIQDKNNNKYLKEFNDNKNDNDNNKNNKNKIISKIKIAKELNEEKNKTINVNESNNKKLKIIGNINNQNKENNTIDFNFGNKNRMIHNYRKLAKIRKPLLPVNMSKSLSVNSASASDIFGLKNYRFIDNKNEEINIINKKDNNSSLNN